MDNPNRPLSCYAVDVPMEYNTFRALVVSVPRIKIRCTGSQIQQHTASQSLGSIAPNHRSYLSMWLLVPSPWDFLHLQRVLSTWGWLDNLFMLIYGGKGCVDWYVLDGMALMAVVDIVLMNVVNTNQRKKRICLMTSVNPKAREKKGVVEWKGEK